ncbi:MAG: P-loop NTPase [Solirubrobacterales bacterium]|nr:P-loop NTPase [Solirubrobacterales bacterium]
MSTVDVEPLWIAVAGKGGAGKSTVSGTLARALGRLGHDVVAMDSDTMPGMCRSLGIAEPEVTRLMEAVERVEERKWRLKPGYGPVRAVQRCSIPAPDGVRLLQLGKADAAENLKPVIGAVGAFHKIAGRLGDSRTARRWTIVGDLPAGPRHLSAGFASYTRGALVVVEPTSQSVLAARRCARFTREHLGRPAWYVANKLRDEEARRRLARMLGEEPVAWIPYDLEVAAAERAGLAPIDAAAGSAAVGVIESLAAELSERRLDGL